MQALALDPKYVKAWAKKGDIEFFMKEYHKALDSYKMVGMVFGLPTRCGDVNCHDGVLSARESRHRSHRFALTPPPPPIHCPSLSKLCVTDAGALVDACRD